MKEFKLVADNAYKERVNKIKKDIDNETDVMRKMKLMEQMQMSHLFSMSDNSYLKYKNPW